MRVRALLSRSIQFLKQEANWTVQRNATLMESGLEGVRVYFFFLKVWAYILQGGSKSTQVDWEKESCQSSGHRVQMYVGFNCHRTQKCVRFSNLRAAGSRCARWIFSGVGTYYKIHFLCSNAEFYRKTVEKFNYLIWMLEVPCCLAVKALFLDPPLSAS